MRPFVILLLLLLAIGMNVVGFSNLLRGNMAKQSPGKRPTPAAFNTMEKNAELAGRINVTISKSSDGAHDYIQIISADLVTTNIVLVVDEILVKDLR